MTLFYWQKIALLSVILIVTTTLSASESITPISQTTNTDENTIVSKKDYEKQLKKNQMQEAIINQKIAFLFGHNYYEFPEISQLVNDIIARLNSGKQAALKAKAAADKEDWQTALLWAQKRQHSQNQVTELTVKTKHSLKMQNAQLVLDVVEQNISPIETTNSSGVQNNIQKIDNKPQELMVNKTPDNETNTNDQEIVSQVKSESHEKKLQNIESKRQDVIPTDTNKKSVQTVITVNENRDGNMKETMNQLLDITTIDGAKLYINKGCIACHGTHGNSPILSTYPLIGGQSKEYIVAQIADIKSGARHNRQSVTMKSLIPTINDQEIWVLAEWLSSLPVNSREIAIDINVEIANKGAKFYRSKTCMTCHGKEATISLMPNYPNLAGQNPDYVIAQIKDIKNGVRNNGQAAIMKTVMQAVNEEEMQAIAHWLASLNGNRSEKVE